MEVKNSITIGGSEVEKVSEFSGFDVYSLDGDQLTLFFCKNGKVITKLSASADCSQNICFISGFSFEKLS